LASGKQETQQLSTVISMQIPQAKLIFIKAMIPQHTAHVYATHAQTTPCFFMYSGPSRTFIMAVKCWVLVWLLLHIVVTSKLAFLTCTEIMHGIDSCSYNNEIRVSVEGCLEICHENIWRGVCSNTWSMPHVMEICQLLGFESGTPQTTIARVQFPPTVRAHSYFPKRLYTLICKAYEFPLLHKKSSFL